jgi:putative transposase
MPMEVLQLVGWGSGQYLAEPIPCLTAPKPNVTPARQTQQDDYNLNMKYRRAQAPGSAFFFTVVTFDRKKIFTDEQTVALLRQATEAVQMRHPFLVEAAVILPDQLHLLWRLPDSDSDYATRWRLIKSYFTRRWPGSRRHPTTLSRQSKGERMVWQRRYWEHLIRDEADWRRHVDYIHYNPVKHSLADAPCAWRFSSFHSYVRRGHYSPDWGAGERLEDGVEVGKE